MTLVVLLTWLGWFGDAMALTGSYFIGGGKLRFGWKCFLVADISLIGLPLYLHAWNLAFLYAAFLVLGIRGILKSRESKAGIKIPADGVALETGQVQTSCLVANCSICKNYGY